MTRVIEIDFSHSKSVQSLSSHPLFYAHFFNKTNLISIQNERRKIFETNKMNEAVELLLHAIVVLNGPWLSDYVQNVSVHILFE